MFFYSFENRSFNYTLEADESEVSEQQAKENSDIPYWY